MPDPSGSDRIVVGQVRRPVGLRGELIVEPTGDDRARFSPGARVQAEGEPPVELTVQASRPSRDVLAVRFEGVESVEEAERFRGRVLTVAAQNLPELPPGVYYQFEILGCEVLDGDGRRLGTVEQILETGGNDVYCVREGSEEVLVPAVPEFIAEVDRENRRIRLTVPRSALGEEEPPV